jgi:hypothetical protein
MILTAGTRTEWARMVRDCAFRLSFINLLRQQDAEKAIRAMVDVD